MLVEIERKTELAKVGITNPFEVHQGRPLTDHVEDWRASLQADGRNPRHVSMKVKQVADMVRWCRFRFIADLSASTVQNVLAKRRRDDGIGLQTSNHYLQAIKQFAGWLVQDRRLADNPLAYLKGGNVKLDRRHLRRAATDTEIVALLAYARGAGGFRGLSGTDREAIYATAFYTGLRASELASLTAASFRLGDQPTVTVGAAYSKHRRDDMIPLHPDAVAFLAARLPTKPDEGLLWPGKWAKQFTAGAMLRKDLEGARLAWLEAAETAEERKRRESLDTLLYTDSAGKVLDFHALRHTFVSRIVRSGMSVKEAQTLARHSDPRLTIGLYAHVEAADTARAMSAVPGLMVPELCTNLCRILDTEGQSARASESIEAKAYPRSDESQTASATVICDEMRAIQTEREGFVPWGFLNSMAQQGFCHKPLSDNELEGSGQYRSFPVVTGCEGYEPGQNRDKIKPLAAPRLRLFEGYFAAVSLGLLLGAWAVPGGTSLPSEDESKAAEPEEKRSRTLAAIKVLLAEYHALLPREHADAIGAAYARYSTKFQDSIVDQLRVILTDAVRKKIFVPFENVFFDEGVRGIKHDRAGLNGLKVCLAERRAKVVFFFATNRLARKTYRSLQFVEEQVVERGLRAVFVRSGVDTADGNRWRMLLNANAMIDEFVASSGGDHIRAAHEGQFERRVVHGTITYGYAAEPTGEGLTRRGRPRTRYVVDPVSSEWVRRIFHWYVADRVSILEILRRLNADPAATPPSQSRKGRWTREIVDRLVRNPRYRGHWRYGTTSSVWMGSTDSSKKVVREAPLKEAQDESLRIVSDEVWYAAQRFLAVEAQKVVGRKPKDPNAAAHLRVLGGLFRCPTHDRILYVGGPYGKYLMCKDCMALPAQDRPLYSMLPRELALRKTCDALASSVRSDPGLVERVIEVCRAEVASFQTPDPARMGTLETQRLRLDRQIAFLVRNVGDTDADMAESEAELRRLRRERSALVAEIELARATEAQLVAVPSMDEVRTMLNDLATILVGAANGVDPDSFGQVRDLIFQMTGGRIELEQAGEASAPRGWLRGRFRCNVIAAATSEFGGRPLREQDEGSWIEIEYREDEPTLPQVVVDQIAEQYQAGTLIKQIAKNFQLNRNSVSTALDAWFSARGEVRPDGRSRRKDLPVKHLDPSAYHVHSEAVKAAADRGLLFRQIAAELKIGIDAVTSAWAYWHTSRGLTVPDGRTRRKSLPRTGCSTREPTDA